MVLLKHKIENWNTSPSSHWCCFSIQLSVHHDLFSFLESTQSHLLRSNGWICLLPMDWEHPGSWTHRYSSGKQHLKYYLSVYRHRHTVHTQGSQAVSPPHLSVARLWMWWREAQTVCNFETDCSQQNTQCQLHQFNYENTTHPTTTQSYYLSILSDS